MVQILNLDLGLQLGHNLAITYIVFEVVALLYQVALPYFAVPVLGSTPKSLKGLVCWWPSSLVSALHGHSFCEDGLL